MQQFARRQPGEGPGNEPAANLPRAASEEAAQTVDQVSEFKKQVAELTHELGMLKAENQKLRVQLTGTIAAEEIAAPASQPTAALPTKESIDEEFLVEWVRGSGLQETEEAQTPPKAAAEKPVERAPEPAAPVAAPVPDQPLSDDEIQKLLAQAAREATDAAPPNQEPAKAQTEPVAQPQPVIEQPVAMAHGFLRVEEATPETELPSSPDFEVSKEAVAKVPSHLAIGALAVPIRIEGGKIFCKAVVPFDRASLDMIADATACEIVPEPAPIEQVVAALRAAYRDEHYDSERAIAWEVAEKPKKRGALARLFRKAA